ncbi:MAG: hypothetical protein U9R17_08300 [Thermodesulfobacteriota bacterium]|nr:hypothetical protein [Thermodesulfobacteriota bacterium]
MIDQIRSLDKRRLVKKIGAINRELLVKACLVTQKLISTE